MAEMKTKLNDTSVSDFLNKIADPQMREDCNTVMDIMKSAAGAEPRMWARDIGFGEYTMTYPNGRAIPWMVIGFSPRKQNLTLYVGSSFPEHDQLLAGLGKHSTGKGCLYNQTSVRRKHSYAREDGEGFGETSSGRKRSSEAIVGKTGKKKPGKKTAKKSVKAKTTRRSTSSKASSRKSVRKTTGKKKSRG